MIKPKNDHYRSMIEGDMIGSYRREFVHFASEYGLKTDEMDVFLSVADYYARWMMNGLSANMPVG